MKKKHQPGCNSDPGCGCGSAPGCPGCPPFGEDGGTGVPPTSFKITLNNFLYPFLNFNGCYLVTFQGSLTSTVEESGNPSGQTCCWWSNAPTPGDWTSAPATPDGWQAGRFGFPQMPRIDVFIGSKEPDPSPGDPVYISVIAWDKANGYMVVYGFWSAFPLVGHLYDDDPDPTGATAFPAGLGFNPTLGGPYGDGTAFTPILIGTHIDGALQTSVNTFTLTGTFGYAASSCSICAIACGSGGVDSVVDNAGNTYTRIYQTSSGNWGNIEVWALFFAATTEDVEVTVNLSATTDAAASVFNFSGVGSIQQLAIDTIQFKTNPSTAGSITSDDYFVHNFSEKELTFGFSQGETSWSAASGDTRISGAGDSIVGATLGSKAPGTNQSTINIGGGSPLDQIVIVLKNRTPTANVYADCNLPDDEILLIAAGANVCPDTGGAYWAANCIEKENPCGAFYSAWQWGYNTDCFTLSPVKPPTDIIDWGIGRCFLSQTKCLTDCCNDEVSNRPAALAAEIIGEGSFPFPSVSKTAWGDLGSSGLTLASAVQAYDRNYTINSETAGPAGLYPGVFEPNMANYGSYCVYNCNQATDCLEYQFDITRQVPCDDDTAPGDCIVFHDHFGECASLDPATFPPGGHCQIILVEKTIIIGRNGNPPSGPIYIGAKYLAGGTYYEYGTPFYIPTVGLVGGGFGGGFKPDDRPDTSVTLSDCSSFDVELKMFRYLFMRPGIDPNAPFEVEGTHSDNNKVTVSTNLTDVVNCRDSGYQDPYDLQDCCDGSVIHRDYPGLYPPPLDVPVLADGKCYTISAGTTDTFTPGPAIQTVFDTCADCLIEVNCCCEGPIALITVDFPEINFTGCFQRDPAIYTGCGSCHIGFGPISVDMEPATPTYPCATDNFGEAPTSGYTTSGPDCWFAGGAIITGFSIYSCRLGVQVAALGTGGGSLSFPLVGLTYLLDVADFPSGACDGVEVTLTLACAYGAPMTDGSTITDGDGVALFLDDHWNEPNPDSSAYQITARLVVGTPCSL